MYKYLYGKAVYEAPGFREARKQQGLTLPEGINPVSHFIVRLWCWDNTEQAYSIEVFDPPGHQVFADYDDALACFHQLAAGYPGECQVDTKLELVQFQRGHIHNLYSRILFPPMLAAEP